MFCKHCGSQIGEYDQFCQKCGNEIIENTTAPANTTTAPKLRGKKKGIIIAVVSVLLCLTIGFIIVSNIKSPKELLTENKWYDKIVVSCEYNDWTSIGSGKGYWFWAKCYAVDFYSDGKSQQMSYQIGGNGGVCGPFSHEITSENIPSHIQWHKDLRDTHYSWDVLDGNELKYRSDYYAWDDEKDTHCNCRDSECHHSDTWYVTNKYLRIGRTTYTAQKPSSLHVDD